MPIIDGSIADHFHDNHNLSTGFHGPDRAVRLRYHRHVMLKMADGRCQHIIRSLGLTASDKVCIVGGGYGWLRECLEARLPGIVVATTDTSTWVNAEQANDETAELEAALVAAGLVLGTPEYSRILSEIDGGSRSKVTIENTRIDTEASRDDLTTRYGDFTWAITEEVISWLTDAECVALDDDMQQMATDVAHLTTPFKRKMLGRIEPPPVWNWKYLGGDETRPMNRAQLNAPWYTTRIWKTLLPGATILGPHKGVV